MPGLGSVPSTTDREEIGGQTALNPTPPTPSPTRTPQEQFPLDVLEVPINDGTRNLL